MVHHTFRRSRHYLPLHTEFDSASCGVIFREWVPPFFRSLVFRFIVGRRPIFISSFLRSNHPLDTFTKFLGMIPCILNIFHWRCLMGKANDLNMFTAFLSTEPYSSLRLPGQIPQHCYTIIYSLLSEKNSTHVIPMIF